MFTDMSLHKKLKKVPFLDFEKNCKKVFSNINQLPSDAVQLLASMNSCNFDH